MLLRKVHTAEEILEARVRAEGVKKGIYFEPQQQFVIVFLIDPFEPSQRHILVSKADFNHSYIRESYEAFTPAKSRCCQVPKVFTHHAGRRTVVTSSP